MPSKSVIDDLFDLLCKLPWWASLSLAPICYFVLEPFTSISSTGGLASGVTQFDRMVASFATMGQIALPITCAMAALISAVQAKRRAHLYKGAITSSSFVDEIDWRSFEVLLHEAYSRQGYSVDHRGGSAPDGGVDLVLRRPSEKVLIQAKHWKSRKVGVRPVRELAGIVGTEGANRAILVTSGGFTAEAQVFAARAGIELVERTKLENDLLQLDRAPAPVANPALEPTSNSAAEDVIHCPRCRERMVRRTARRGANPGKEFWGCTQFPKCRGTRNLQVAAAER